MQKRILAAVVVVLSACAGPSPDVTTPASPTPASPSGRSTGEPAPTTAQSPSPTPTPRPVLNPFYPGIVLVQEEQRSGFERIREADGVIVLGHSYSAFGAACTEPTDVVERMAWGGDVPKMLYASLAPEDLDWRGRGCAGSESRLRDDAIEEFARRNLEVAAADPRITRLNFWNELKGYAMPKEMALFADHYVRWASTIKAERPDLQLGGPYTHGAFSDETLHEIHGGFIDLVVTQHPELVDFIVSGDSHRPSTFYTDIYADRGITLRHWQPEWYPGGHDPSEAPSIDEMIHELLDKAANPLMEGVMLWGSGPLSSDSNQAVPLWDDNGHPTAYWWALVEAAEFTAMGQVERLPDGSFRNGAGQVLTLTGTGPSIDDP